MRNDRDAARMMNHLDHFGEARPVDVHAAGPSGLQKAVEGLLILLHDAFLHEPACEVGARQIVLVVGERKRPLVGAADAVERFESFSDQAAALVALDADAVEEGVDAGRAGIQPEPDDVHDASAPARRNLHARNESHAELLGGGRRLPDAVHRIVVGERHELHAVVVHEAHEVCGRKLPVGNIGVHVQVDDHPKPFCRRNVASFDYTAGLLRPREAYILFVSPDPHEEGPVKTVPLKSRQTIPI